MPEQGVFDAVPAIRAEAVYQHRMPEQRRSGSLPAYILGLTKFRCRLGLTPNAVKSFGPRKNGLVRLAAWASPRASCGTTARGVSPRRGAAMLLFAPRVVRHRTRGAMPTRLNKMSRRSSVAGTPSWHRSRLRCPPLVGLKFVG
ncbi:hypothetical protein LF1_17960 [Rubripirellula obstinata]|uniref:Uncharacterized protein n=1 Tax=Rubripirellula obstinata TaxID=406547 RepID=A0A5B1CFF6_9BACT|nr:hypothetical protein LF1_17960 [Rubripirellula obstinata]